MHDSSTFRYAHVIDQDLAWRLRRNCSVTPQQLGQFYASLSVVSLVIGVGFWLRGAPIVLVFAALELLALGAALLIYALHATDGETVMLHAGKLIVERDCAGRRERIEFASEQVRIAPLVEWGALIDIRAHGREVAVGRYVRPEVRPALAGEMRRALQVAACGAPG